LPRPCLDNVSLCPKMFMLINLLSTVIALAP